MQKWSFNWTRDIWNEIKWRSLREDFPSLDLISLVLFVLRLKLKWKKMKKENELLWSECCSETHVKRVILLKKLGKKQWRKTTSWLIVFPYFCCKYFLKAIVNDFFLTLKREWKRDSVLTILKPLIIFQNSNWTFQKQIDCPSEDK